MIKTIKFWWNPREFIKSDAGKSRLRTWAKSIYKIHDHACQKCGYRAGGELNLEAHHLDAKAWFPKKAFNLKNGVCLCSKCHKGFHNHMGGTRAKCTEKDYLRWVKVSPDKTKDDYLIFIFLAIVILEMCIYLYRVIVDIYG